MLVILLFELLHHAACSDIPKHSNYMTRTIASCPDEGYFFKRDTSPNAIDPMCYLCFCQDNSTAICWKRENQRCDLKHHLNIRKRDNRVRRSPLSLGDVLVRDAAREFFNRQSPEQCKPYESSFSDGCPPADWCIGCTVCDCDANGRWDCHILSFCPDKNGKKQIKKERRGALQRSHVGRRHSKKSTTKAISNETRKPSKKPTRKNFNDQNKEKQLKQTLAINKRMIDPVKGTKTKKIIPIKKSKIQSKKGKPNAKEKKGNHLLINKGVPTNKSINTKPSKSKPKTNKNSTVEVAQKVVKQFMTTMQKMMKNIEKKTNRPPNQQVNNKVVNKRSMQQNAKIIDNRPKFAAKPIPPGKVGKVNRKNPGKKTTSKPRNSKINKTRRKKRQVDIPDKTFTINESKGFQNGTNTTDTTFIKRTERERILVNSSKNSCITYSPSYKLTIEPVRLETKRDVYITDNKVIENNSIKHEIYYYTNNNITTPYQTINNITTSTPSLYDRGYDINDYHKHNNENLEVTVPSTRKYDWITKFAQIGKNDTRLRKKQKYSNNESINHGHYANITKFLTKQSEKDKNNVIHNCKFRTLLQTLLGMNENNINSLPKKPPKPKRFTIVNKIKRLFRKNFGNTSRRKYHNTVPLLSDGYNIEQLNENETEHFKLEPNVKIKLRNRIAELQKESEEILRTIRIIKGLLHILELNTNETIIRGEVSAYSTSKNIIKLNKILKDTFIKEEITKNLTNDQRTQINYIKENVKIFIKSIGKFATILDDVIQIVMRHSRDHNRMISTTMRSNSNVKSVNEFIQNSRHNTMKQKLKKLKELMINYNILQNKFIYQIYSLLNNLENMVTTKTNVKTRDDISPHLNNTDVIETNSANIIRNIRKLKALADKLNINGRRKREAIGDEDAIEYLLILMEYLLKRHAPTNPPVNDGIDLLIEAIKNAPDIKPIKKKVLEYIPVKTSVTRTASPIQSYHHNFNHSKWDTPRKEEINVSTPDTIKIKTSNQTLEYDDDDDEDSIEEFYRKFKNLNDTSSEQIGDNVVDPQAVLTTTESYIEDLSTTEKKANTIISKFQPIDDNLGEEVVTTYQDVSFELKTTTQYPTTTSYIVNKKISHFGLENSTPRVNKLLVDTKGNKDWIEENFKDLRKLREQGFLSTSKSIPVTRTHKPKFQNTENLSDISNELVGGKKKKIKKLNANDAMTNKQMDLLNSLDYVAEKDVEDVADSKEENFLSDSYA